MSAPANDAAPVRGRILCVDDEPHVLRSLQWLLKKEFEVHVAANAADGLRLLRAHDFDVVVSDQRMPGTTGVEFLREVRRLAPRAMRILLTGYSDLDAMVRSVNESEVYRFITKPWDIRELPRLIGEAASIARATPAPAAASLVSPAAAPASDVTTVAMRVGESVIVIDDNPEVHRAVTEIVGNTVQVRHAYNLPDAVRMMNEQPVDVILSEVRVGNLDATRLVRLMKARNPEVVSVVFSSEQDAQTVMLLINQGQVYRFIPKPFKNGFIRIVLDAALKQHRRLAETPALLERHRVQPAGEAAAQSLLADVERAAAARPKPAAIVPAANEPAPVADGVIGRLRSGFRSLFGSA